MNATETETDLLGFLLGANDPATDRAVRERLSRDSEFARMGNRLRRLLEPLAADRAGVEPPADLALNAIGFVARHIAAGEIERRRHGDTERPTTPVATLARSAARAYPSTPDSGSSVQRRNWFAGIGLAAAALIVTLPAIAALRSQYGIRDCTRHLMQLHQSLAVYADARAGQFPFMERGRPETDVVKQLQEAGVLPADHRAEPGHGDYAYSLGYREGDRVQAMRQDLPDREKSPILADPFDFVAGESPTHRHGQNVLFIDGHVQFCRNPNVGIDRDHIYINKDNKLQPGVNRADSVLVAPDEGK